MPPEVAADKARKWQVGMVHGSFAVPGHFDNDEVTFTEAEVAASKLDYLALGHWHSFREGRAGKTVWAYSGAPEPVALKIKARVGGVFTMVNSRLGGIIPQGGLWRIQQRPDQFHAGIAGRGTSPLHPGQAFTLVRQRRREAQGREENRRYLLRLPARIGGDLRGGAAARAERPGRSRAPRRLERLVQRQESSQLP